MASLHSVNVIKPTVFKPILILWSAIWKIGPLATCDMWSRAKLMWGKVSWNRAVCCSHILDFHMIHCKFINSSTASWAVIAVFYKSPDQILSTSCCSFKQSTETEYAFKLCNSIYGELLLFVVYSACRYVMCLYEMLPVCCCKLCTFLLQHTMYI